jgi:ribose transport system substrate-binding protein
VTKLRAVVVLSVAVALVALLAGCPKPSGTTPPAGTTPAKMPAGQAAKAGEGGAASAKWTLGMSQCNLGEPWRQQMKKDIEEAAKQHPEISVIFKDAQNKTEQQQAQVREFISQGVDLIIISPKEAVPLTAPVAEAMNAGIPVIVLDRKIQGDKYTCFIGGDNVLIGREAGKYMVKLLKGKGRVVELQGLKTSTPAGERHKGFMEGIEGSQIDVIYSADCQWLEPNAQREMNSALTRFDQIDAVYGHNDPSAHGAYMAAQQEGKGREKTIQFVGIDGLPHEGVQYVKDGILAATFEYPTGGAAAITTALEILGGKSVPKDVTLGTRLYTPENVNQGGQPISAPATTK